MEINILLTISYDGSKFHGWQVQKNAHTVQVEFQNALFKIAGQPISIKGCSRTDTGVHALQYCISFNLEREIPLQRLVFALNNHLPPSVAVLNARYVPDDFHARYSCQSKQYRYQIWNSEIKNPFLKGYAHHYRYKIDEELLNTAAKQFLGRHDFTSFCTKDAREKGDLHRTILKSEFTRSGDMVCYTVKADGFLYNMVRIIVGTLLGVQQGRFAPEDIGNIINKCDRKFAGATAPACGLYLEEVNYDI